jgi:hypothetical protein
MMRAPLGRMRGGTASWVYALIGIGASCWLTGCSSSAMPPADVSVGGGGAIDDASLDASSDAESADTWEVPDGDDARPDAENHPDIFLDSRGAPDGRGAPDVFAEGVSPEGAPPDAHVVPDASSRDGAGSLDGVSSDGVPPSDGGPPADAAMRCNGYEALCDRRFDEVVFPTAHNAMSNADDGWVASNQQHGMKRQLEDGIRGMLIDTYSYLGTTYLCHSSCLLGSKLLVDALRDVTTFLQNNPHEVLTFVIEDHISAAETETAFVASGLADFVYTHPAGSPWPTLRTMITSGRRVLVGAESGAPPPPWYHHFYDLAWDTPYSFKSTSEFSCQQNRGSRQNALFLLNHWVENPLPDEGLSRTANAHDVLLSRARQCQTESGKLPNFVAVSHYAVGDLFAVVRELNGL